MAKKEIIPLVKNEHVGFYDDGHDYVQLDTFSDLCGVTGILHKYVFPDMYQDVDEETLRKAAQRGSAIHQAIEDLDNGKKVEELDKEYLQQITNYLSICKDNNLKHEASEYLVSDNEFVASAIDKVFRVNENSFILADIKTTYKLHEEYVRWQLSIYKYLFELQNPNAKVKGLYAIWLRNEKSQFVELEPIDKAIIVELLTCAKNECEWTNPLAMKELAMPDEYLEQEDELLIKLDQLKDADNFKKAWVAQFKEMFDADLKIKSFVGKQVTISKTQTSHKVVFDESRFALENPELYKQYCVVKETAASIRININK